MKLSKRFTSLFMAFVMCLSMTSFTAFAAEEAPVMAVASADEASEIMPRTNDYASCWVPAGETSGYFTINKTFSGDGGVTFKARSDNTSVKVDMKVSKSNNPDNDFTISTGWVTVPANDTEKKPDDTVGSSGTFYVHYKINSGNPNGTFLMCWIYG